MKIILFSNTKNIYDLTKEVIQEKSELVWCTYDELTDNQYPYADIVIMYFDKKLIAKGVFEAIVRVKGKLGHVVPILTLIEEATPQDIFSILKAGAYDYIVVFEDKEKYRKKINEIILWNWYLKEYRMEAK